MTTELYRRRRFLSGGVAPLLLDLFAAALSLPGQNSAPLCMHYYHVSCVVPARIPAEEGARIANRVDAFLHALRPPPASQHTGEQAPAVGHLVQIAKYPDWLLNELVAISPHVNVLIVPLERSRACVVHPEEIMPQLKLDRDDWTTTCVRFAEVAGKL